MNLDRLTKFIYLTHQFRDIRRSIEVHGGGRPENDMEHSYQVALVAWYLIERDHLELDTAHAISLALVHDLVEAYAGDTNLYAQDGSRATKADREAKAALQLQASWPDFPSLHTLITEYESLATPEAEFVYALDKLITILNNYTDGGRSWHQAGITLEQVKAAKAGKVDRSPAIAQYYQELISKLEASPHLFPDPHNLASPQNLQK